jgi:hypothetical protein
MRYCSFDKLIEEALRLLLYLKDAAFTGVKKLGDEVVTLDEQSQSDLPREASALERLNYEFDVLHIRLKEQRSLATLQRDQSQAKVVSLD